MQIVLTTLLFRHDLALVALAAIVCALSTFAGVSLLHHARRTEGPMQLAWLGVAAVSVGFGIWATHFIAEMAFSAGMPGRQIAAGRVFGRKLFLRRHRRGKGGKAQS